MIIVKTTNGDRFINEAETLQVCHIKDKAQVGVWPSKLVGVYENPQVYTIEHVEAVIYTNATQPTEWQDKGSQLEKLEKQLDERMKWGNEIRTKYIEMEKERDQLKDEVEELRNRVKTLEDTNAAPASAPKHKINLRATSPVGSDCTQAFDVEGCDGMTVKDFILAVIKNDPFVTIDIMRDGKYIWNGEYNHQAPRKERTKELSEELLLLKIKSARAAGGYGRMSYNVKLY